MPIDPHKNIDEYRHAQEMAQKRREVLRTPWPWRIWAYGAWLAGVLPEPQDGILVCVLILGTIFLVCMAIVAVSLLVVLHMTWPLWLLAGYCLRGALGLLGRGVRSLARMIRAVEDEYRTWED